MCGDMWIPYEQYIMMIPNGCRRNIDFCAASNTAWLLGHTTTSIKMTDRKSHTESLEVASAEQWPELFERKSEHVTVIIDDVGGSCINPLLLPKAAMSEMRRDEDIKPLGSGRRVTKVVCKRFPGACVYPDKCLHKSLAEEMTPQNPCIICDREQEGVSYCDCYLELNDVDLAAAVYRTELVVKIMRLQREFENERDWRRREIND